MTITIRATCAATVVFALSICPYAANADADTEIANLLGSENSQEQLLWAERYEHGEGVTRNIDYAVRLYCVAANAGSAAAQFQLGWLYFNARGVARDDVLASAWFHLAAESGDEHAQRMIDRLAATDENTEARCITPDGGEVYARAKEEPIQSEPSPDRATIEDWVHRLAHRYEVDPKLVLAVIAAESNFNPVARSPKNAEGLMQLIPKTAKRFGVENSMDPLQNIHGGMAYLRWLLAFFKGDVTLALAGYNAGEEAVERYRGVPPYAETRMYVKRILRAYGSLTHQPVAQIVEPSVLVADRDAG